MKKVTTFHSYFKDMENWKRSKWKTFLSITLSKVGNRCVMNRKCLMVCATIESHRNRAERVENHHESLLISLVEVIIISHKNKLKKWIFMQGKLRSGANIDKSPLKHKVLKSGNQRNSGRVELTLFIKKWRNLFRWKRKIFHEGNERKFVLVCSWKCFNLISCRLSKNAAFEVRTEG